MQVVLTTNGAGAGQPLVSGLAKKGYAIRRVTNRSVTRWWVIGNDVPGAMYTAVTDSAKLDVSLINVVDKQAIPVSQRAASSATFHWATARPATTTAAWLHNTTRSKRGACPIGNACLTRWRAAGRTTCSCGRPTLASRCCSLIQTHPPLVAIGVKAGENQSLSSDAAMRRGSNGSGRPTGKVTPMPCGICRSEAGGVRNSVCEAV